MQKIVIIIEVGLIKKAYLRVDNESAQSKVVELANNYFIQLVGKRFATFQEVEEFQYTSHTDRGEILIVDETPNKEL